MTGGEHDGERAGSLAGAHRLTKAMRLRRRREFLAVSAEGRKVATRHFIALLVPRPHQRVGRLGITVTKKIGHAPTRNRIRRFTREWLRTHGWLSPGWDVVLVAKTAAAAVRGPSELAADLLTVQRHLAAQAQTVSTSC